MKFGLTFEELRVGMRVRMRSFTRLGTVTKLYEKTGLAQVRWDGDRTMALGLWKPHDLDPHPTPDATTPIPTEIPQRSQPERPFCALPIDRPGAGPQNSESGGAA